MTQPPQDPWAQSGAPDQYPHGPHSALPPPGITPPSQPQYGPQAFGPTGFPPPYPTTVLPVSTRPPSRWKRWHKISLGVIGALVLFFCGIALFAPDPETPKKAADPGAAPAIAQPVTTTASSSAASAAPVRSSVVPTSKSPAPKPQPVSYTDCDDVEAAGKAPIRKGQAGFQKKFDLDGDGKGCELNGDDNPLLQDDEDQDSEPDEDAGTDPRFSSCAKANAAGYGPYQEGSDPEYDWYQDRDGDGEVCE
ncbi:excalibur calcium-binding domain-containing protein [Actinoplanes awajinensis]|uniref:excalibur calcium-binding domain-containing protein n=1 Tax=Actinoplanes awajinensis TaxID=135946 RepID=UPI0018DBBF8F|nr:excalibur calcium-binding domain-containing protein [Actinoplanes awajinensis]